MPVECPQCGSTCPLCRSEFIAFNSLHAEGGDPGDLDKGQGVAEHLLDFCWHVPLNYGRSSIHHRVHCGEEDDFFDAEYGIGGRISHWRVQG